MNKGRDGAQVNEPNHILVLGYNAWDVSLPVVGAVDASNKCEVAGIHFGGGGPGATAAVALARLGSRVKLVTVFGDDQPSRWQEQELVTAGVDVGACLYRSGALSPKAVILVAAEGGERTIYWSRGELSVLDPTEVQISWLNGQDLFYTDGHETQAAVVLATEAKRRGLTVVLDAGSVRKGSAELVGVVTDAISSTGFAPELTGCPSPAVALRALRRRGPLNVAMTFGAGGVLGLIGDRVVHVPAFAVRVIDTTGAGDAFHAGYAFARAEGKEFFGCLEFGSAVAALKCAAWGGRNGLPRLEAVRSLIKNGSRLPLPEELSGSVG